MESYEHVLAARCELGEGPLWHPEENALYWTDITGMHLHRWDPRSDEHSVYEVGFQTGSFAFRASGGLLLAAADGFAFWQPGDEQLRFITHFPEIGQGSRFNDGKADSAGRFWAGPVHAEGKGFLYRLDPDGTVAVMETGIRVSNGLGWSPDDRLMYYTDSETKRIDVYDFEAGTGSISNRRPFARIPDDWGVPDGLTVDEEGCIWCAIWGGWRVVRYRPDGRLDREIRMPVACPSSCTFGGPNLDELYITSARVGMDEAARRQQPLAGDIFRIKAGVGGFRPNFYP
jgi:sugar lactone lactonase YvrE